MTDDSASDRPDEPAQPPPSEPDPSGTFHQELQHALTSARVPERVGPGVYSTGAIVFNSEHEFVLDFLCRIVPPHRVTARVVLPPGVLALLIRALRDNLDKYQQRFGVLPRPPAPPPGTKSPPISEIYENLKLPDDMLSGVYANTVMIVHTPAEFCFDFVTGFYPRSAVSCRVFLSAPHVPVLLDSLTHAFEQYRRKLQGRPPPPELPGDGGPNVWQVGP